MRDGARARPAEPRREENPELTDSGGVSGGPYPSRSPRRWRCSGIGSLARDGTQSHPELPSRSRPCCEVGRSCAQSVANRSPNMWTPIGLGTGSARSPASSRLWRPALFRPRSARWTRRGALRPRSDHPAHPAGPASELKARSRTSSASDTARSRTEDRAPRPHGRKRGGRPARAPPRSAIRWGPVGGEGARGDLVMEGRSAVDESMLTSDRRP
jgi:hypothetical protein